jgi:hypothetical protein
MYRPSCTLIVQTVMLSFFCVLTLNVHKYNTQSALCVKQNDVRIAAITATA